MMGRKFVDAKKQEFEIKEFIRARLGKGKISEIKIERTPIGEKIVITTARPGFVIGRGSETIQKIDGILKRKFKFENPQIEVVELQDAVFDAQTVADQIATSLERFGPLRFKLIAYQEMARILNAGALGAEIRLSGKLPSERAKSWRFSFGYMQKTGASSKIVNYAQATAFTKPGVVGVKVSIVPKNTKIPDKIEINKERIEAKLKELKVEEEEKIKEKEQKIEDTGKKKRKKK